MLHRSAGCVVALPDRSQAPLVILIGGCPGRGHGAGYLPPSLVPELGSPGQEVMQGRGRRPGQAVDDDDAIERGWWLRLPAVPVLDTQAAGEPVLEVPFQSGGSRRVERQGVRCRIEQPL